MYSIVDLETTGFSPTHGDRIIEIGIVKIGDDDQIVDKYSTLINPDRDISNYFVHGIEPGLVKNAPKFDEVRDFIKSFLNGSTLVAHNAPFDLRFLDSELLHQEKKLDGICTIKLSRMVDTTLPCRKLDVMCEYYDIEISNSHQALADAVATTELFINLKSEFLARYGNRRFQQQFASPVSFSSIDGQQPVRIEYKRTDATTDIQRSKTKLHSFINRLSIDSLTDNSHSQQYLDTLNEILSDRIITNSELVKLEALVNEFSLTKEQILELHKQYLTEVIRVYFLDGKISEFELRDLIDLTQLLGLTQNDLDDLISKVKAEDWSAFVTRFDFKKQVEGKSICFTGQLQSKIKGTLVDRSLAQNIARQRGMIIKNNVSKKLDYLVAANPNTMSGKAKKAREYGLKILAEPEFWRLIGVNVE